MAVALGPGGCAWKGLQCTHRAPAKALSGVKAAGVLETRTLGFRTAVLGADRYEV